MERETQVLSLWWRNPFKKGKCTTIKTVPSGISHARDDLFKEYTVTHTWRWNLMYMTHVAEICRECTVCVCHLIGSNYLERQRGTNDGLSGSPAPTIWRKCLFLPMNLYLGSRKPVWKWAKLFQEFQQQKEDRSYSSPVQTSISAISSECSFAQEGGYRGCEPQDNLWFYLGDHKEDVQKWDGKSTLTLEAWVRGLQRKAIINGVSSRQIATPVFSGQFPSKSGRVGFTSDPMEINSDFRNQWGSLWPVLEGPCLQTGERRGQPHLLDYVDPNDLVHQIQWGSREYQGIAYTNTTKLQRVRIHLYFWSNERSQDLCWRLNKIWEWVAKTPLCDRPRGPMHLPRRYLRRGYFKDLEECWWAFSIAALE